ncbi:MULTISPECIES: hypothetical protein [unclassified Arsenophonus]|uniref:hypothetical protein n=1 Tax=unclassified Arsenophonus TaxID=2627083 RepID=UPI002857C184|nr:hypothetical protein [Arsenophonus sp.]MDR5611102.1 hypothetical protein [Arsenophonus sp.]MDR5615059.1 hypothetical protein [Arsenophonus sp.]
MKKMLYKPNGDVNVWGMMLQTTVVNIDEVEEYLSDGWHLNPNDTKIFTEPEKKPRKYNKRVKNADNGEG